MQWRTVFKRCQVLQQKFSPIPNTAIDIKSEDYILRPFDPHFLKLVLISAASKNRKILVSVAALIRLNTVVRILEDLLYFFRFSKSKIAAPMKVHTPTLFSCSPSSLRYWLSA